MGEAEVDVRDPFLSPFLNLADMTGPGQGQECVCGCVKLCICERSCVCLAPSLVLA